MPLPVATGYFLAGVLATNSVPHFIIALTGRTNLTPFGRDSSPRVNALRAMLNATGAYLLMRAADHAERPLMNATAWQLPYEAGCLCWSGFGLVYALMRHEQSARPPMPA